MAISLVLVTIVTIEHIKVYLSFHWKKKYRFFHHEKDWRYCTDSFPKEINKAKIKDIFEILKSQDRPDLVEEMKKKTSLLLKLNKKTTDINVVLPTEIVKKILENLDYKSLCSAKQTFKRWKDIIDEFKFVAKSLGKILEFCFLHLKNF